MDRQRDDTGKMPEAGVNGKTLFHSLTPVDDVNLEPYKDGFGFVFADDQIINVALSGMYGSGKSSVIKTWEKEDKGHEYLHISSSHFVSSFRDEEQMSASSVRRQVESHLLNQLINSIDLKRAPRTRFHRTSDASRFYKVLAFFLSIIVLVIIGLSNTGGLYGLLKVGRDTVFSLLGLSFADYRSTAATIVSVVLLILLVVLFWKAIYHDNVGKIVRKLELLGAKVELSDDQDDAVFDRYLDDIVYLLDHSGFDVIVFEDIDRYGTLEPLEDLREICMLVNNRRTTRRIKKEDASLLKRIVGHLAPKILNAFDKFFNSDSNIPIKPLRFFYLISDGLFSKATDRVKFFDFIIPVIPFVDSNNSFVLFRDALSKQGIQPDEAFLYQLSLFITDARMMYEIINESAHYKNALVRRGTMDANADANQLIATMAYKTMFPADYEAFQQGRGYLRALFDQRTVWAEELDRRKQSKSIREEKDRIEEIKFDYEYEEVRNRLLLGRIFDSKPQLLDSLEPAEREHYDKIQSPTRKIKFLKRDGCKIASIVSALESQLSSDDEFDEMLEYELTKKSIYTDEQSPDESATRNVPRIYDALSQIDGEYNATYKMSFSDIIKNLSGANPFVLDQGYLERIDEETLRVIRLTMASPSFPALRYLVASGYLDEACLRFTSIVHEGDLDNQDHDFVLRVISVGSDPAGYSSELPNNPKEVISRLTERDLMLHSAWNYKILRELLSEGPNNKLHAFLGALDGDDARDFLFGYLASNYYDSNCFIKLFQNADRVFWDAIRKGRQGKAENVGLARDLIHWLMVNDSWDDIVSMYNDFVMYIIKPFANQDRDFLSLDNASRYDFIHRDVMPSYVMPSYRERVASGLIAIAYKAEGINCNKADSVLLRCVLNNALCVPDAKLLDDVLMRLDEEEGKPIESRLESGKILTYIYHYKTGDDGSERYPFHKWETSDVVQLVQSVRNYWLAILEEKSDSEDAITLYADEATNEWVCGCFEKSDETELFEWYLAMCEVV